MNEDFRIALRRKGYVRQDDGSYSLVAPRLPNAGAESESVCALDESASDETPMLGRARVRITRKSTGRLDRDNLWASVKSLLDGLQKAGLIVGDSEADIELEVSQERVQTRDAQGTEIVIEQL